MPTTSNFGWTTPADTDLVKDGAAAIRTLGNGVDTSFVDLKGGTTGQVLSKASNTDLDYSWVTPNVGDITEVQAGTGISVASGTGPIPVVTNTVATAYDAKGDLIVGTGADTFAKLTVGTNGHTLVADSSTSTGLKWEAPAGGGSLKFISRTAFSNVASQAFDDVFNSTYQKYYVALDNFFAATGADDLQFQFRYAGPTTETANYYGFMNITAYNANITTTQQSNTNQITLHDHVGANVHVAGGYLYIANVGNTSQNPLVISNYYDNGSARGSNAMGGADTDRTYTGFLLKSSSSNISGTVTIYGLANS